MRKFRFSFLERRGGKIPLSAHKINSKTGALLIPVIYFLNRAKLYSVRCRFSIETFSKKNFNSRPLLNLILEALKQILIKSRVPHILQTFSIILREECYNFFPLI